MATLNVPADFATIQAAVDAATSGDSIVVASGYPGNELVVVPVDGLTVDAPADVAGIVLRAGGSVTDITLAGTSAIRLIGNAGNNTLTGNDGDNVIGDGQGGGADTLDGGAGDDTLQVGGGIDTADGGAGSNDLLVVDYSLATTAVATANGSVSDGAGSTVTYQNIERLRVYGGTGNDTLFGGDGDDFLAGGAGSDTLFGNADGVDTLYGGDGDDTFQVNGGSGSVNGGDGTDTVNSNDLGGWQLTRVERLDTNGGGYVYASPEQLRAFDVIDDSGGAPDSAITFRLTGAGGEINLRTRIAGAHGAMVFPNTVTSAIFITGTATDDTLFGSSFDDTLEGRGGNDFISNSSGGTDTLSGGAGDDTIEVLYGGAGTIAGNEGTDTVHSNDLGTFAVGGVEILDTGGFGEVRASVAQLGQFGSITDSTAAADSRINLLLTGAGGTINLASRVDGAHSIFAVNAGLTGAVTVSGSDNDDYLVASDSLNTLNGGAGNDTFEILYGTGGPTAAANGGAGSDTVRSNALGSFSLKGMETLDTYGYNEVRASVAQLLQFSAITDSLAAADSQIAFILGDAGGTLNLGPRVQGAHAARVVDGGLTSATTVIGTANGDHLVASAMLNDLRGAGGDDTLEVLYGGTGSVTGGDGSDTVLSNDLGSFSLSGVETLDTDGFAYVYATAAQLRAFATITDSLAAPDAQISVFLQDGAGGIDFSSRVAGAQSIHLFTGGAATVTGSNNDDILEGSGTAVDLSGADGDDRLMGSTGADRLAGGAGDDTFVVDNPGDIVVETFGAGTDTVETTLLAYQLGRNVENLLFTGSGDFAGTGNKLDNAITGGTGGDTLDGGAGDDTLAGGGGLDTLEGGIGSDDFVFEQALVAGNVATVLDFAPGSDTIALSVAIFTQAGAAGSLDPNAFFSGSAAAEADDRIGYDAATGNLAYDADGAGGNAAVVFAVLQPGLAVTAADIRLF